MPLRAVDFESTIFMLLYGGLCNWLLCDCFVAVVALVLELIEAAISDISR